MTTRQDPGPDPHTLTVEATATGDRRWLVLATCTCLGFARQAFCANPVVANHGKQLAAEYHAEHVLRVRSGADLPEQRPAWLPDLPTEEHLP